LVDCGTVRATRSGAEFSISGADGRRVHVVNVGSPPELFAAGVPVVVVGQFVSSTSRTFESTQIMVKHSATYVARYPGRVRHGAC